MPESNISGVLTIKPIEAEIQDSVFSANSAPKLFCQVKVGSEIQVTLLALKNGKNFSWSPQELTFRGINELTIQIEVYHKNFFISPDLIGQGEFRLAHFLQSSQFTTTCFILGGEIQVGKLNVEVKWEPYEVIESYIGSSSNLHFEHKENIEGDPQKQEQIPMRVQRGQDQMTQTEENMATSVSKSVEQNKCLICVQEKKLVAFYKCGHICCCENCAKRFLRNQCPICRQRVNDFIKVYQV